MGRRELPIISYYGNTHLCRFNRRKKRQYVCIIYAHILKEINTAFTQVDQEYVCFSIKLWHVKEMKTALENDNSFRY